MESSEDGVFGQERGENGPIASVDHVARLPGPGGEVTVTIERGNLAQPSGVLYSRVNLVQTFVRIVSLWKNNESIDY